MLTNLLCSLALMTRRKDYVEIQIKATKDATLNPHNRYTTTSGGTCGSASAAAKSTYCLVSMACWSSGAEEEGLETNHLRFKVPELMKAALR